MIDIRNEDVISFLNAAKLRCLPTRRRGKRPHVATLYRWSKYGVRGVLLESIMVGGTRCTSIQALQRFFNRLNAADSGDHNSQIPLSKAESKTPADKVLEMEGF